MNVAPVRDAVNTVGEHRQELRAFHENQHRMIFFAGGKIRAVQRVARLFDGPADLMDSYGHQYTPARFKRATWAFVSLVIFVRMRAAEEYAPSSA
jgi:hypothetical protein